MLCSLGSFSSLDLALNVCNQYIHKFSTTPYYSFYCNDCSVLECSMGVPVVSNPSAAQPEFIIIEL